MKLFDQAEIQYIFRSKESVKELAVQFRTPMKVIREIQAGVHLKYLRVQDVKDLHR